jgi:hypothetical protein
MARQKRSAASSGKDKEKKKPTLDLVNHYAKCVAKIKVESITNTTENIRTVSRDGVIRIKGVIGLNGWKLGSMLYVTEVTPSPSIVKLHTVVNLWNRRETLPEGVKVTTGLQPIPSVMEDDDQQYTRQFRLIDGGHRLQALKELYA